jgi:hypothetical protein
MRVIESLRGGAEKGAHIVVRQSGGHIGEFHQTAAGQSRYEPGEEVVVFLEPVGSEYVEIGIGISKYSIEWNGLEKIVSHRPEVAEAHVAKNGQILSVEPAQPMKPEPLARFIDRVRSFTRTALGSTQ